MQIEASVTFFMLKVIVVHVQLYTFHTNTDNFFRSSLFDKDKMHCSQATSNSVKQMQNIFIYTSYQHLVIGERNTNVYKLQAGNCDFSIPYLKAGWQAFSRYCNRYISNRSKLFCSHVYQ